MASIVSMTEAVSRSILENVKERTTIAFAGRDFDEASLRSYLENCQNEVIERYAGKIDAIQIVIHQELHVVRVYMRLRGPDLKALRESSTTIEFELPRGSP